MDQEIVKIAQRYADEVKDFMVVRMVVLYGSHVNGTPHKDSDIDIAVIVDEFRGDYLAASAGLFRLARGVNVRIEPVLLSRQSDKSGFLEHVVRQGIIIYKQRQRRRSRAG
jgi:predicted nucleotidyltransferase